MKLYYIHTLSVLVVVLSIAATNGSFVLANTSSYGACSPNIDSMQDNSKVVISCSFEESKHVKGLVPYSENNDEYRFLFPREFSDVYELQLLKDELGEHALGVVIGHPNLYVLFMKNDDSQKDRIMDIFTRNMFKDGFFTLPWNRDYIPNTNGIVIWFNDNMIGLDEEAWSKNIETFSSIFLEIFESKLITKYSLRQDHRTQVQVYDEPGLIYEYVHVMRLDEEDGVMMFASATVRKKDWAEMGDRVYRSINSIEWDKEKVRKTLIKSKIRLAKAGDENAQFQLGMAYASGIGVEKNVEKMMFWLKKSANAGQINAQYALASVYSNDRFVKPDNKLAAKWMLKSARNGIADAQYAMGVFYEKGIGVDQDKFEANKWYSKAADQGHDDAIKRIESGSF